MEKMPFQPELTRTTTMVSATTTTTTVTTSDWKAGLPVLAGTGFTLRELRLEDAASLLAMLTTEEVSRFISPPPTTVEGFERFILWAQRERQAGKRSLSTGLSANLWPRGPLKFIIATPLPKWR